MLNRFIFHIIWNSIFVTNIRISVNKKITEEIQKSLKNQLSKYASNMTDEEYNKYEIIDDLLFEIDEQNSAIKYLSFGKETEFLHKFVQVLCNHF